MVKFLYKKFTVLLIIFGIVLSTFMIFVNPISAKANDTYNEFDTSNVLDDLMSSSTFNIEDYPYSEAGITKHAGIIAFIEYCYSFKAENQGNYALYLYFYNPQCLDIDVDNFGNKVQMGTSVDENSKPINFKKFSLTFCNMSQGDYYQLFYKFRIDIDKQELLQSLNSNVRRYDISGFELVNEGEPNAEPYRVGGTYKFNGYASGCGPDVTADSTLVCDIEEFEVAELDVHHTYFRSQNASVLGDGHQNQLNSVYFAVDNALIDDYGYLQKILAEWYEYKTSPIIVTNNSGVNNDFDDYIGVLSSHSSVPDNYRFYYGLSSNFSSDTYEWAWNIPQGMYGNKVVTVNENLPMYTYLFYRDIDNINDVVITSDELLDYMYNYNKSHLNGYLPIKDSNISADLFLSDVDEGRTKGYNERLFDVDNQDDWYNLMSYDSLNKNWFEKLLEFGFWAPETGGDFEDVLPIYEVKESDLSGTDVEISERLLIAESDVNEFKEYVNLEMSQGRNVFLFRFAHTDYFSKNINFVGSSGGVFGKGYVAQETMFFDFDIIELTFNKNGEYTVIAAVSSPIDIVADITPPLVEEFWLDDIFGGDDDGIEWWEWLLLILGLVIGIILLVIFYPVLKVVVKGLIWLICLPFKLIGMLIQAIKKSFNKKRRQV